MRDTVTGLRIKKGHVHRDMPDAPQAMTLRAMKQQFNAAKKQESMLIQKIVRSM